MEEVKSAFVFTLIFQVTVTLKVIVTLCLCQLRHDLFQDEGFGTVDAGGLTLVRNDQQTVAFRARLRQRPLP